MPDGDGFIQITKSFQKLTFYYLTWPLKVQRKTMKNEAATSNPQSTIPLHSIFISSLDTVKYEPRTRSHQGSPASGTRIQPLQDSSTTHQTPKTAPSPPHSKNQRQSHGQKKAAPLYTALRRTSHYKTV